MRVMSMGMVALLATAMAVPAGAGGLRESETALRGAYGAYRAALFLSNQGKAEETTAALAKFNAAWDGLAADWGAAAPPQYADDAELGATFAAVDGLIDTAAGQVASGDLPRAHLTLEGVRDQIGALHERNGIIGFSDRMNAFHAAMEEVLEADYAALGADGPRRMAADAAVLDYLAAQIVAHPAPEAAAPDYQPLVDGFAASVRAFSEAARAGDLAAGAAAQAGLKVPYSKLFAKFG